MSALTQSGKGAGSAARATGIGVLAILLWAALALLTVRAGALPPFQLLTLSFGVAFAGGVCALLPRGRAALAEMRQPLRPWLLSFGGIFCYHALYFYALSHAPAAQASLIAYLWPLFIVLFSALAPGGRLQGRHVLGAVLGLAGTALIALDRSGAADAAWPVAGIAAAFGCALIWSGYSVLNRRYANAPSSMMVGVCGLVAVAGAACHAALETTVPVSGAQWGAIVLLGLGPTGLAFLAWDYATKHGHLALLGPLSYLAPLLSTLLLVLTGETPATLSLLMAALLIIGGSVVATIARR
ncbi:aromatic amino acid exporter YddG [Bordetella genomosp. 11]|uniref:EamA family transporter n=1 Tax=Bordetella genomosp. 11 TaxID=1416808 RepID=A0A261UDZ8_9BORD|nr:DMT family transporter [Bordetella genomosp. 11]OZI60134.1 EamA family transporter [Bordetella genomosp. 11]